MTRTGNFEIYINAAKNLKAFIVTGAEVVVTDDTASGATSIPVQPLKEAINSSKKVRFLNGVIATLNSNAVLGATSLSVDATAGDIQRWETGQKVFDLTGKALRADFRRKADDAAALFSFTVGSGITIDNAADGELTVAITAAESTLFDDEGEYMWDLWNIQSGEEEPLIVGEVKVKRAPSEAPA